MKFTMPKLGLKKQSEAKEPDTKTSKASKTEEKRDTKLDTVSEIEITNTSIAD